MIVEKVISEGIINQLLPHGSNRSTSFEGVFEDYREMKC